MRQTIEETTYELRHLICALSSLSLIYLFTINIFSRKKCAVMKIYVSDIDILINYKKADEPGYK